MSVRLPSTHFPAIALALVASIIAAESAEAQVSTMCVSGCTVDYRVDVTPDGSVAPTRPINTSGHWAIFNVKNTGRVTSSFDLICVGSSGVTCTSMSLNQVTLAAGAGQKIFAEYAVGNAGTGRLQLMADGNAMDIGFWTVPIGAPNGTPGVAFKNLNGTNRDRSMCLTAGAGESAAFQCGDLLVTHSMPGFTTMGKERSLTLLYQTGQAYPSPIISATITMRANVATPASIYTELRVNGILRDSSTYRSWGNGTANVARQIGLSYRAYINSTTDSTGVYPFTLLVRNIYANGIADSVLAGRVMVVNRAASRFGGGWWISGLEQLYFNQPVGTANGDILWAAGDGSAKLYTKQPDGVTWIGAPGGFQDTLRKVGGVYTRHLRHGAKVTFNDFGRHTATIGRTGQQTTFGWSASLDTLKTITLPPAGATGTAYTLAYSGGVLDKITDPAGRVLDATITNGDLLSLKDPDNGITSFTYNTSGNNVHQLVTRTNRRGVKTLYHHNVNRMVKVSVPLDTPPTKWAETVFRPWDHAGVTSFGHNTLATADDTAEAYTRIQGPRPNVADDAHFWVDQWGAPTKMVDAIGATTYLVRGDGNHPALVTRVEFPSGRVATMSYNARGNLKLTQDLTPGLPTKETRYGYDGLPPAIDSPDTVSDGLGRRSLYTYNALGLTETMTDQRNHQTRFFYRTDPTAPLRGVLDSVAEMQVLTWQQSDSMEVALNQTVRFLYDAVGNVRRSKSPVGVSTTFLRDAMGRVMDMYDPFNTVRHWDYDPLNRVKQVSQYTVYQPQAFFDPMAGCENTLVSCFGVTPATSIPGLDAALITRYAHGTTTLDTVIDPRGARRGFSYDARGLVTAETDEHLKVRKAFYNEAGLMDSVITRTGHPVRYTYDAVGRRRSMIYDKRDFSAGCLSQDCVTATTIPGDTVEYTYDIMGNQLTATNNEGTITRTYFGDGSIQRQIRVLSGGVLPDTLQFSYDEAGARIKVVHGGGGITDSTLYRYNRGTGDLDSVLVWWGADANPYRFAFAYDALGRRRQVNYPHGAVATLSYDALGIMRRLKSTSPTPATDNDDLFKFDLVNQKVDPVGNIIARRMVCAQGAIEGNPCGPGKASDGVVNAYNRLGMLVRQEHNPGPGVKIDSMDYDASGNLRFHHDGVLGKSHLFAMEQTPTSNRMRSDTLLQMQYTYFDDGARDEEYSTREPAQSRWYYYDGLGRMTGTVNWYREGTFFGLSNNTKECRYDADGQLTKACANLSHWLAYDGHNVSGTANAAAGSRWRFIHAGLDDPLMGLHQDGNDRWVFFWLTDGQGRQYAVADSTGDQNFYKTHFLGHSGTYAGGTSAASSFAADRFGTPQVPQVSFFRNRAYDQRTGRWTQEDPIGLAGGLNLYQFNGNNPVSNTDPFGLCVPACALPLVLGGGTGLLGKLAAVTTGAAIAGALVVAKDDIGNTLGKIIKWGADVLTAAKVIGQTVAGPMDIPDPLKTADEGPSKQEVPGDPPTPKTQTVGPKGPPDPPKTDGQIKLRPDGSVDKVILH